MKALTNPFLSEIADLSEIIKPRRKTLVDRLIGRLAVGHIRSGQSLYEVHGPYVVPGRSEQSPRRPFAPLIAMLKEFGRRQNLRRAMHDMSQLDERMLKDIGLTRPEIEVAARGYLRRDTIKGTRKLRPV
ncbi:hypothetical protein ASE66_23350 [Bosea sp. Root483D1]|uniref:DUF1127 domain-containing protein n=1 Tax=Bosea sp. Root483D1 TaxID=1736544 RepID=UPI000710CC95|nr:DUF1127 domain-containing protein [Bosea sp. Root483D1]KRE11491.1 hypothetical protein ASE66_23350 [Bosea sp. Root483D1]